MPKRSICSFHCLSSFVVYPQNHDTIRYDGNNNSSDLSRMNQTNLKNSFRHIHVNFFSTVHTYLNDSFSAIELSLFFDDNNLHYVVRWIKLFLFQQQQKKKNSENKISFLFCLLFLFGYLWSMFICSMTKRNTGEFSDPQIKLFAMFTLYNKLMYFYQLN